MNQKITSQQEIRPLCRWAGCHVLIRCLPFVINDLATGHFVEPQAFSMPPSLPSFRAESSESRNLKLSGV